MMGSHLTVCMAKSSIPQNHAHITVKCWQLVDLDIYQTDHKARIQCSQSQGKVGRAPPERRRGAHLPFKAIEPVGG